MKLSISEILKLVDAAKTEEEKIALLHKHHSQAIVDILQGVFDDRIKWLLPEGQTPYKPSKEVDIHGALYTEMRRMYLFVEGGHPTLAQNQRERIWIQLLESVDKDDAAMLNFVKDKKLPYPTITYELFRKAYPNISIVHEVKVEEPVVQKKEVKATKPKKKKKPVKAKKKETKSVEVQEQEGT